MTTLNDIPVLMFVTIFGAAATVLILFLIWRLYKLAKMIFPFGAGIQPSFKNTPLLLSFYTRYSRLELLKEWREDDLKIQLFLIQHPRFLLNKETLFSSLVRVQLPFRTKSHLIGIPKNPDVVALNPSGEDSAMEEVVLEGDYPNYFRLFADRNQQTETRYHLDPAAMAFTVDFCRSHNWELIEDQLYFLQSGSQHETDPTNMTQDIKKFVREIRPSVEIKNTPMQNKLSSSYGDEYRTGLRCPLCSKEMKNQSNSFVCPDGDGVLLQGANLSRLKKQNVEFIDSANARHTKKTLKCPSCEHDMHKVPYSGGKTIIDSCTNCPYRWIDHGEIKAPTKSVRKMNAHKKSLNY